jgi:hypothetical protein
LFPETEFFAASPVIHASSLALSRALDDSQVVANSPRFSPRATLNPTIRFTESSAPRSSTAFSASVSFDRHGQTPTGDSGSRLALILGILFGLIVLIAIVVSALLYVRSQRAKREEPESEVDPVARFYSDNRRETEAEFEMAFENPVFDRRNVGELPSDDQFEQGFDETLNTSTTM